MDAQLAPTTLFKPKLSSSKSAPTPRREFNQQALPYNNSLAQARWWHAQQPDNFIGVKTLRTSTETNAFGTCPKAVLPVPWDPKAYGIPIKPPFRIPKIFH